jgi:hypothetical protein
MRLVAIISSKIACFCFQQTQHNSVRPELGQSLAWPVLSYRRAKGRRVQAAQFVVMPLTAQRQLPNRHGDSAMCMRFWCESTRGCEKWVKLSLGHFLGRLKTGCHAHSPPKPGHIALSPRRSGSLFCLLCVDKTQGKWPIMVAGFEGIFNTRTKQTKIRAN